MKSKYRSHLLFRLLDLGHVLITAVSADRRAIDIKIQASPIRPQLPPQCCCYPVLFLHSWKHWLPNNILFGLAVRSIESPFLMLAIARNQNLLLAVVIQFVSEIAGERGRAPASCNVSVTLLFTACKSHNLYCSRCRQRVLAVGHHFVSVSII